MILCHKIPATSSDCTKKVQFCFWILTQSEGGVYLQLYKLSPSNYAQEEGEWPNQSVHEEALPEGHYTFPFV